MASGRLHGTVALATGASSGIGEATARALAGEGARVALVARRRERHAVTRPRRVAVDEMLVRPTTQRA